MKKHFTLILLISVSSAQAKSFDFKEDLQKVVGGSEGQKKLDLSGKKIKKLPSNVSAIFKPIVDDVKNPVQIIDLSDNKISGALKKGTFSGLVQPTQISLNNNNITDIQPGTFHALNSLEIIDLSHNKIKDLPVGAFKEILGLSTLNLSYNNLSTFGRSILEELRLLYYLDLSHNKIKKLEAAMFAASDATSTGFTANGARRASNLNTIDLQCNPIKTVEVDVFAGLQELKLVLVSSSLSAEVQNKIQESIDQVNLAFNRTGSSKCMLRVTSETCQKS